MYGVTETPVSGGGRRRAAASRDARLALEQRRDDGVAGKAEPSADPTASCSDGVRLDRPFGCTTVVVTPAIDDTRCAM